mmetsp:Transcript_14539/g.33031  ORF Transcript_14539/g.33031 Transcript_14539/m.33031 type:complete len:200 (+) Transcript_14539:479-1078(+)
MASCYLILVRTHCAIPGITHKLNGCPVVGEKRITQHCVARMPGTGGTAPCVTLLVRPLPTVHVMGRQFLVHNTPKSFVAVGAEIFWRRDANETRHKQLEGCARNLWGHTKEQLLIWQHDGHTRWKGEYLLSRLAQHCFHCHLALLVTSQRHAAPESHGTIPNVVMSSDFCIKVQRLSMPQVATCSSTRRQEERQHGCQP